MNYLKYIRNMIKAKHVLVKQYDDLSALVPELQIENTHQKMTIEVYEKNRAKLYGHFEKHEERLRQRIEFLEEQSKKDNQQMLIHANEKRSLIALLKKRDSSV